MGLFSNSNNYEEEVMADEQILTGTANGEGIITFDTMNAIAGAIRTQHRTTTAKYTPAQMVSNISTLRDVSDETATTAQVLDTVTFYDKTGNKVSGAVTSKAAATYTPGTTDQTIAANQYLSGAQTISGDADLIASNIKTGVQIFNVTGNFTADADATAGDILNGKTAYVNGTKITGNISTRTKNDITLTTSKNDSTGITITATINNSGLFTKDTANAGITEANLIPGNIKTGVTALGVAGTFTSDANAAAADILSGKTAYVGGSKVTGSITSKAAATYTPGTSNQTIAAGQYLSGAQTILGDTDLAAGNIKTGVTIFDVSGTFTADATAVATDMRSGVTAYVNGSKVTGSLADYENTSF